MQPCYIAPDHVVHCGALFPLEEAPTYLRPGRYRVRGRLGHNPVSDLILVVRPDSPARLEQIAVQAS